MPFLRLYFITLLFCDFNAVEMLLLKPKGRGGGGSQHAWVSFTVSIYFAVLTSLYCSAVAEKDNPLRLANK
jgi:hypothetical protein